MASLRGRRQAGVGAIARGVQRVLVAPVDFVTGVQRVLVWASMRVAGVQVCW